MLWAEAFRDVAVFFGLIVLFRGWPAWRQTCKHCMASDETVAELEGTIEELENEQATLQDSYDTILGQNEELEALAETQANRIKELEQALVLIQIAPI